MISDYRHFPIDQKSADRLASSGLVLKLVDTSSGGFSLWLAAEARGFHEPQLSQQTLDERTAGFADRRTTGVWDHEVVESADAADPVATVSSWPTALTVPGFRSVQAWAVSAVTVSPTHRRRGIARALLEAELRTAQSFGFPIAILTVSEATIYERFGFAPSAFAADVTIDTSRTVWAGPEVSGRVRFVTRDQLLLDGPELLEHVRLATPGQIKFTGHLWERRLGLPSDPEATKKLRYVRYDDAEGVPRGFAVYRVTETEDYSAHVLDIEYLVASTDDAYAGLWRFFVEMDLVKTVKAPLRSITEPVLWQLSDMRAVTMSPKDHLWSRIVDVPAAMIARSYSGRGQFVFAVTDPLGIAAGRFLLAIDDDGMAFVSASDDYPDLTLGVNELSAIYLGGVSAVSLVRAGRIRERHAGVAAAVDRVFGAEVTPWLSIWF